MAHIELQLISKIIRTGGIYTVLDWGITESDFVTTEGRGMFSYLMGIFNDPQNAKAIPGPNFIRELLPDFVLCDDESMTLEGLCTSVRKHRLLKSTEEIAKQLLEGGRKDPLVALGEASHKIRTLQTLGMRELDEKFSKGMSSVLTRYDQALQGIPPTGIVWPWAPFNEATGGLQEDDYTILYGRPKSMKSFVLAFIAARVYTQGFHPLIYTKEMPAWQLWRRIAAFAMEFIYDELRLGRLTPLQHKGLMAFREEVIEQEQRTDGKHTITVVSGRDAPAGTDSISWLRGKIEKHRPNAIFIDGLYLMAGESKTKSEYDKVTQVSRAARQMVMDCGIPLLATVQANRAAAKHDRAELDELAFSDAFSQDATMLVRTINEKVSPTIALVVGGSREFKLHGIRINALPCNDFSFREVMTEKDIAKAKEKDTGEEGEKNPAAHIKPITSNAKTRQPSATNKLLDEQLKGVLWKTKLSAAALPSNMQDVLDLVRRFLIGVKRSGPENIMAICPFHMKADGSPERTPSFAMSLTNGLWVCHSCKEKGNLASFLRRSGVSRDSIDIEYGYLISALTEKISPKSPLLEIQKSPTIPEAFLGLIEGCPLDLLNEGFGEDVLAHFEVGFDERNMRITYPLRDMHGRLVGINGRAVGDGYPRYKVYDKKEFHVWGLDATAPAKGQLLWNFDKVYPNTIYVSDCQTILVEGHKACMWVYQSGFRDVVALMGSSMSYEQRLMLERLGGSIYIFLDNDFAGKAGRRKVAELLSLAVDVHVVLYEEQQPTDLSEDGVATAIRSAVPYALWRASQKESNSYGIWKES